MQRESGKQDPEDAKCVLFLRNSRWHNLIGMYDMCAAHMTTIHTFCSMLVILVHFTSLRARVECSFPPSTFFASTSWHIPCYVCLCSIPDTMSSTQRVLIATYTSNSHSSLGNISMIPQHPVLFFWRAKSLTQFISPSWFGSCFLSNLTPY